ncbi:hypothetical protein HPP92_009978 [Vanilla planifolia]|uniref:DUF4704 domain-containing protein n=1 Tax=Vanilla planifolia TaxID=51239 RepID=A0A835R7K2_VANPL|nr:hypothetical protein HPP92_009978 [Vanilla planifolia]
MLDDPQEGAAAETPAEGSPSPESGVMLTLTSSSSSLNEDDLFEPVSLRDLDLEGTVPDFTIADASIRSSLDSAGDLNVVEAPSNELHVDQNFYSQQFKPSSSTASFDSYSNASSSVGSPPKPKVRQLTMPDIPPELVHLVDSVIMGSSESMEKLKLMVSGDESLEMSRSVVDALLATMGGVEGLDEMDGTGFEDSIPSAMLTSRAAVVAAELIPCLPGEGDSEYCMSPRTRMAKGLLLILNACTRNRVMCSGSGLLRVLLDSTEKIVLDTTDRVRWNAWPLFNCLQVLGGHSLSVVDLERWLILIKKSLVTELAMPLMMSLENVICSEESRGPACTFEFDGDTSGLLAPGESRWPFSNGYAFVTWIYIELLEEVRVPPNINTTVTSAAANSGRSSPVAAVGPTAPSELVGQVSTQIPRIFSFVSADNHWIEAYFYGQFLAVEVCDGKGKKSSIRFKYEFKPQCWYFLGLEHSYKQSLLGKAESEVRLYVDGSLHETRPFELVRTSKPLSFCSIGTNPPPTLPGLQRRKRQCALFGEMGPIYIFKEPIGPDKMTRLALRGGDVLPSFGKGAGSPCLAVNEHVRSLAEASSKLDADVGGSLHLLYHPNLLNNRLCQDASPFFSTGIHQRHAEVLGQVHVATRARPTESLWALAYGGPMALLPLVVSGIHMDNLEPKLGDLCLALASYSLSATVFRIISMAIQYPGNNEELCRTRAPELLSRILYYLLTSRSNPELRNRIRLGDEDLVSAVASLCQCQKNNHPLKVQLFRTLLLDLKMWGLCNYGLQKKLLSSLADMVFSESSAMRDANALQTAPAGEVNALVDELLIVIELLMGAANLSLANEDVRCLLCFLADCPQPNQVARVLHLIYRNAPFLLQQEAKKGNQDVVDNYRSLDTGNTLKEDSQFESMSFKGRTKITQPEFLENEAVSIEVCPQPYSIISGSGSVNVPSAVNNGRISGSQILKSLGGIRFSLNSESSRSNVFNIDNGDGIVVAIISLLGSLHSSGYLKFNSNASSSSSSNSFLSHRQYEDGSTMFDDKVSLLLFALQKALQAAPQRLMTTNVQMAFLVASIDISSLEDGLNIYGSGHCLEHFQLLVVLLRALPHASCAFQMHTIQDLLFLACSHPENRSRLTSMAEWPEWILEVLISNYEMAPRTDLSGVSIEEIEDLIHNFLIIVLEYSMRKKDGWKDVEATIHCAEWLSMIGGSSTGEQRMRREEVLPIFKRRLLASLLDFAAWELQAQTQVIASAAAGVSKTSPQKARAEAENAAQLSVALAENAIVVLMLVEDHLRLQGQQFLSFHPSNLARPTVSVSSANHSYSISLDTSGTESFDLIGSTRTSLSKRAGSVSFEALASVADENGEVPATVMERFTVAAAAEPYEAVQCAFVSYGSCILDLAESWKSRSRMWYGIELPSDGTFGGGASGWNSWKSVLEKDSNGKWIELPLVNKSIVMLQSLLLDESGIGGGLGIGSGSGTGMGGITALYHLLDSEQPFLCMLRMILLSMREDDDGEYAILARNTSINDGMLDGIIFQAGNGKFLSHNNQLLMKKPRSALLWSVLGPILNMPVSESRRQRVLVACCVMYSEVWLAIGRDKKPMRKNYLESILPPFIAVLRRWRPILATIHELTSSEVENPFTADDHALSADALPLEAALAMISPGWSAVFASPPAALALAMIAAGASGGETTPPPRNAPYRRETSLFERSTAKLHTFSSFKSLLRHLVSLHPCQKTKQQLRLLLWQLRGIWNAMPRLVLVEACVLLQWQPQHKEGAQVTMNGQRCGT